MARSAPGREAGLWELDALPSLVKAHLRDLLYLVGRESSYCASTRPAGAAHR